MYRQSRIDTISLKAMWGLDWARDSPPVTHCPTVGPVKVAIWMKGLVEHSHLLMITLGIYQVPCCNECEIWQSTPVKMLEIWGP